MTRQTALAALKNVFFGTTVKLKQITTNGRIQYQLDDPSMENALRTSAQAVRIVLPNDTTTYRHVVGCVIYHIDEDGTIDGVEMQ